MNCVVTAGPTCEPLDEVRRLTNFSTGRLGSELANVLMDRGHHVILLLGNHSTYQGPQNVRQIVRFSTANDLREKLESLSRQQIGAVFHAAAVSDFAFGKVWTRLPTGQLSEMNSRKISSRETNLLAELIPTPKIIGSLRQWFPTACLVGWKYEVEGDRASAIAAAQQQVLENGTNVCVVNGPAYGHGFGLLNREGCCTHLLDSRTLEDALAEMIGK
ncbi:MAG: DNA/pantothenate metabolism flavoprotein domain protein [Pedosphaera sp.]|nr:DNA/pantothenate metabolism flavoprotein domain protein [Pedosphaera sp.]